MRAALISTLSVLVVAGFLAVACVDDVPQAPSLDGAVTIGPTFFECPPPFLPQTVTTHEADRNGDGIICVLVLNNGTIVTIDNNVRRPDKGKKG